MSTRKSEIKSFKNIDNLKLSKRNFRMTLEGDSESEDNDQ